MHIGNQSLAHGRNLNSLLGSKRFKGYVIALRMEFLDQTSLLLITSGRPVAALLQQHVCFDYFFSICLGFWLFMVTAPVTLPFSWHWPH